VALFEPFYPAVDNLIQSFEFIKENPTLFQRKIERLTSHFHIRTVPCNVNYIHSDILQLDQRVKGFDAVMQVGCFGTLETEKQFMDAVADVYERLNINGAFLMINWLGNANRPKGFNSAINEAELYEPSLQKAGFKNYKIDYFMRIKGVKAIRGTEKCKLI